MFGESVVALCFRQVAVGLAVPAPTGKFDSRKDERIAVRKARRLRAASTAMIRMKRAGTSSAGSVLYFRREPNPSPVSPVPPVGERDTAEVERLILARSEE